MVLDRKRNAENFIEEVFEKIEVNKDEPKKV